MSELKICRICLDSDVQMHPISGSEVHDVYEKLTNTQVQNEGRLYFACYICYGQLKKSQQLVIKSQKSEELLKQILLNPISIKSVDRQLYGLVNSFVVSNVELFQITECHINIKTESHRECDTDDVVVKDEPDDDCAHANEEWCKVDKKQNFIQDEVKSIENIYGTQSNTVGKENESFPLVRYHTSKHLLVNNYKKYFMCNDCGKKCATKDLLIKHINGDNCTIMIRDDNCKTKQKLVFEEKIKKSDSLRKGTHTIKKRFQCEYCNNTYAKKNYLKSHIRKHTGEKPFKCEYCNYTCAIIFNLKRHIRTHTGEKPFKCEYCNYSSALSSTLKRHVRTHTGEKPFKCEYCNYSCTTSGSLQLHVRTHTGEKPFKCEYCNNSFSTCSTLKEHVRTHTGEKPFKCKYCNHSCTTSSNLNLHIRTHTGEKPFKCEYCNYSCATNGSLKVHVRTHTGERPFKCKYCNYTCTSSSYLKKHLRTHTRK